MGIELYEEQRLMVLEGKPITISAPEMGGDIVLLRAEEFAALQEILEDDQHHNAFRQAGLRSAARWMKENPY